MIDIPDDLTAAPLNASMLYGIFAAVAYLSMTVLAGAQGYEPKGRQESTNEYLASHVRVNANSATMFERRNYYVTLSSGPVGSEGIPAEIRLGDVIEVSGRKMRVGLLVVTEYLQNMEWNGQVLARKGQVACAAAENGDNLPWVDEDDWRDRLWVDVQDCTALSAAR
jgi:hypothetical protein